MFASVAALLSGARWRPWPRRYRWLCALVLVLALLGVSESVRGASPDWSKFRVSESGVIFGTDFSSCTAPICPIDTSVWKPVDQGSIGAPSFWIETDVDANGMRYESGAVLEQTKNIFSPNSAADPYAGTFLQYIGAGSETLTNYDIYVAINAAVNGLAGVMFRIQDSNNYYRFVWSNTEEPGVRASGAIQQLQVVANGSWNTIATAAHAQPYPLGDFVELHVRCDHARLQVFINGELSVETSDNTFSSGTWALYNARCPGIRYANVLVTAKSAGSDSVPTPLPFPIASGVRSAQATIAPLPAFQGESSRRVVFPLNFTGLMLSKFTTGVSQNITEALLRNPDIREALLSDPPLVLVDLRAGSVIATYAGVISASALDAWQTALNRFVCRGHLSNLTALGPVSCGADNVLAVDVQDPNEANAVTAGPAQGISTGAVAAIVAVLIVLALVFGVLLVWCLLRRRRQRRAGFEKKAHFGAAYGFQAADAAEKGTLSPTSLGSEAANEPRWGIPGGILSMDSLSPLMLSLPSFGSIDDSQKPFSIVQRVQRLLVALVHDQVEHFGQRDWLLVLDARTAVLLKYALGPNLAECFPSARICLLEQLPRCGNRELELPTIYILAPTGDWMTSVARYEAKRSAPVPVRLLLTRSPSAPLPRRHAISWADVDGSTVLLPIHVDFFPIEEQVVSIENREDVFGLLYGADAPETCAMRFQLMEELGHQIGTLLHGMGAGTFANEAPWIQIHTSPAASEQATCIARAAQTYAAVHLLPLFCPGLVAGRGALHLLLMDRAVDPVTPLLHVSTYRGMLLELNDAAGNARPQWPSEHDAVWRALRQYTLSDAVAKLQALAQPLLASSEPDSDNRVTHAECIDLDLASLKRALESLQAADPAQLELLSALRWHAKSLERCLQEQQQRNLLYLSALERCIVMGIKQDQGSRISSATMRRTVEKVLEADTYALSDKLRLLLVFLGCRDPHLVRELVQKIPGLDLHMQDSLIRTANAFLQRLRAAKWATRSARVRRRRRARVLVHESLGSLLLPETMASQILLQYMGAFDLQQRHEVAEGHDDSAVASDHEHKEPLGSPAAELFLSTLLVEPRAPSPAPEPHVTAPLAATTTMTTTTTPATQGHDMTHDAAVGMQLDAMPSQNTRKGIHSEDAHMMHSPGTTCNQSDEQRTAADTQTTPRVVQQVDRATPDVDVKRSARRSRLRIAEEAGMLAEALSPSSPPSSAQRNVRSQATVCEALDGTEALQQQQQDATETLPEDAGVHAALVDRLQRAAERYRNDRFLFVVLGGVTALEVEQIRGLATHLQIDVVIGGTSVLSPHQYLASIESL